MALKNDFIKVNERMTPDIKREVTYLSKISPTALSLLLNGKGSYDSEKSQDIYDCILDVLRKDVLSNAKFLGIECVAGKK